MASKKSFGIAILSLSFRTLIRPDTSFREIGFVACQVHMKKGSVMSVRVRSPFFVRKKRLVVRSRCPSKKTLALDFVNLPGKMVSLRWARLRFGPVSSGSRLAPREGRLTNRLLRSRTGLLAAVEFPWSLPLFGVAIVSYGSDLSVGISESLSICIGIVA
ncbi:hypothetical protein GW17_00043049 [Ensete ventricosum]|nr:hypothetical protein GW17_00043049 [Ensete ventricosum]RZR93185.1 hypothetical protein BHM03_00021622 [Ensete ventricosum]